MVLIVGLFIAAGFWYVTERNDKERERNYQRQQERREKDEARDAKARAEKKAEDEKLRKERASALAKEDAVRLFLEYIGREESRLKEEVEELKLKLETLDIDRASLSDELVALEKANAARVGSNEKRHETQRDMVERVHALLRSPTLNRLANTYCKEDLSALRAQFDAEMQRIKDIDDHYQKRLLDNQKRYDETVAGADETVDRKMRLAREKYKIVMRNNEKSNKSLAKLKKQLTELEDQYAKLSSKTVLSRGETRRLPILQSQIVAIQTQILQQENIGGISEADVAHMDVTEAETQARRRYDRAGKTLTIDNDNALMERDHEQAVFDCAKRYEHVSLGKIRQAMNSLQTLWEALCARSERKIAFLNQSSVNVDLLNADELEALRKKVASSITANLSEGGL